MVPEILGDPLKVANGARFKTLRVLIVVNEGGSVPVYKLTREPVIMCYQRYDLKDP